VIQSRETSRLFSSEVLKEIDYFNAFKQQDFKSFLSEYANLQIVFHDKSVAFWEEVLPVIAEIKLPEESE
jgi:hypothetical protein